MQRGHDRYFVPCAASAAALGLASDLGIALAFGVHVQNGGFKPDAVTLAARARLQYQADVLSRKNTIATGQGRMHGASYQLAAWGLGDDAAA